MAFPNGRKTASFMLEMQNKQQKFLSGTTTIHLDQTVNVLETPYPTKVGRLSLLQFMYSIALQLDGAPSQPLARPSEADESSDSEHSDLLHPGVKCSPKVKPRRF